jgi:S-adenosylmethionine-dependent methyltransferase
VGEGFTDAYFLNPEQIEKFMSRFKLKILRIMAVEGLGAIVEEKLMHLKDEDFHDWLDVLEAISSNQAVRGSCEHMLYIGRKGD